MDLPPELICTCFLRAGCVLRGSETSKTLHRLLRSCGSESRPLFLRALADGASLSDFMAMAAFIKSFRYCVVLVVFHLRCTPCFRVVAWRVM